MPLIRSSRPRAFNPGEFARINDKWAGVVPTAILGGVPLGLDGRPLTRVGVVGSVVTANGVADTFGATGTNLLRCPMPNAVNGAGNGASLLAIFRTRATVADRLIAGFGSDQGSSGNTIFALSSGTGANPQNLRGIVGNSSQNQGIDGIGTVINDGRLQVGLVTLEVFADATVMRAQLYLNGRQVATTVSASVSGLGSAYSFVCAAGARRGGTDLAGAQCDVLAVVPFRRWLPQAEAERVTADPWQLFERKRIWVPVSAATGMPILFTATFVPGSLTSSGFRPRVTATWS